MLFIEGEARFANELAGILDRTASAAVGMPSTFPRVECVLIAAVTKVGGGLTETRVVDPNQGDSEEAAHLSDTFEKVSWLFRYGYVPVGSVRADVKATSQRARIHHLSWAQCNPPPDTTGLVISLFVESSGGGMSLAELLSLIETRLAGRQDLVLKLQETVATTLGDAFLPSLDARFDDALAHSSIQVFDLRGVPAIRGDLPAGVGDVHFSSDLGASVPLTVEAIAALPEEARSILP